MVCRTVRQGRLLLLFPTRVRLSDSQLVLHSAAVISITVLVPLNQEDLRLQFHCVKGILLNLLLHIAGGQCKSRGFLVSPLLLLLDRPSDIQVRFHRCLRPATLISVMDHPTALLIPLYHRVFPPIHHPTGNLTHHFLVPVRSPHTTTVQALFENRHPVVPSILNTNHPTLLHFLQVREDISSRIMLF